MFQEDEPRDIYHTYSDTGERLYGRRKSSVPQKPYPKKNSISQLSAYPRHSGHSVESLGLQKLVERETASPQLSPSGSPTPDINSYPKGTEFTVKEDLNKKTPLPDITPGHTRNTDKNYEQSILDTDGSSETSSNYNSIEGGQDERSKMSPKWKESDNPVEREVSLFGLTSVKLGEKEKETMKKVEEQQEYYENFNDLDVSPVPTPKVSPRS